MTTHTPPVVPPPLKQGMSGWPWEANPVSMPEMDQYPRISIALPTFRTGEYLEETLRSILMQGYPNLELIVMDGGSKDDSVAILQHYDSCIAYWESKKDKGQSDGINKAFERCTGDIITFQNSDDLYMPGTFFTVAELYTANPGTGVFAGGFYFMDPQSQRMGDDIPAFLTVGSPADLTKGPPNAYRIHQNAVFYSREALDTAGRYVREDLDYTMDRDLLYRVVKKFPVVLTQQTFGAFRKHPESKSTHSIRPFAKEWAALHREHKTGDSADDRKREAMARFRLYRGEIQYAKIAESKFEIIQALVQALTFKPMAMFTRSYIALWYKLVFRKRVSGTSK